MTGLVIFIDESGFAHDMPRTHGYAAKGKRCIGTKNWSDKGRTNAIGALHGNTLLTLSLFDTTINADIFTAWVVQDLLPKLPQKSVIVMDNATFHKRADTQTLITNAGHLLLFLPPYSPDLNPIEHKWAQSIPSLSIINLYKIGYSGFRGEAWRPGPIQPRPRRAGAR
jgi:transposase